MTNTAHTDTIVDVFATYSTTVPVDTETTAYVNYTENCTELSIDTTLDDVLAFKIAKGMDMYLPPFLYVIGIVSNIFVIMVMRSPYFRNVSTSFYLMINAVSDCSSVALNLSTHWLYVNFPNVYVRSDHSDWVCKVLLFYGWGSSDFGVILTAAMTLERAIAVSFPLNAANWCTVRRAKITTLFLFLFTAMKDCIFIIRGDMVPATQTDRLCDVNYQGNAAFEYYWTIVFPWLNKIYLVLCFIVIIGSNIVILRSIKESDKIQSQLTQRGSASQTREAKAGTKKKALKKGRSLSLILLADSFTVIVLTLPFSIFTTIIEHVHLFDNSPQGIASGALTFTITFYFLYINRCVNFFLYCLTGSRFKKALRSVVCGRCLGDSTSSKYKSSFNSSTAGSTQTESIACITTTAVSTKQNGHKHT